MANFLKKHIIIVGAGISGIACACYLKQLGFSNVKILEARNRIGGRIHTLQLGPHFIEIGAQWIHGQKDNIIYEIADFNDLINKKCVSYMETIESFKHLSNEKRELINLLSEELEEKMKNICFEEGEDSSLLSYLNKHFDAFMTSFVDHPLKECLYEFYDWLCKFLCELNGCQNLSLCSKQFFNDYKECEGEPTVELNQGYCSILKLLLENIPSHWILKNNEVNKIDWCEYNNENSCSTNILRNVNKKIKVVCQNNKEYFADHVVVTLPLGVLKKKHQSMFYPNLSPIKQQAISCLGFGIVNKIYIKFDVPFWEKYFMLNVLWNKKFDKHFPDEFYKDNKDSSQHWVKYINRFAYVLSHPSMICAWITGEGAVILESLTDDKVINDCMKLLELLAVKKLPRPSEMLRSSWSSDPFAYGTYSYISTKCKSKKVSHVAIAEPEYSNLDSSQYPVLLFAGEASHEYYFSTVHGAYESGIREAQRLFLYYRKQADLRFFRNLMSVSEKIPRLVLNEKNWRKNIKIIVVGAGIAGLSCALQLFNNHFTNIHILEALDYIGGRVQSIKYDNDLLELGAQWIHGTENELYEFLKFHKILPQTLDNCSEEGKGLFCSSSGNVIAKELVEKVKKILDQVKSEIEKKDVCFKDKKSVFYAFSEAFEAYVKCCEDKSNIEVEKGLFDWYVKFEVIDNACESLDKVAVQSYAEWEDCPFEEYHINAKNGFSSIVDFLRNRMPTVSITVNKPVKTINWFKDNEKKCLKSFSEIHSGNFHPCSVECEDGESLNADCVIVTSSIGFLKQNHHTFFVPPLPSNKCKALENVGFGTINKLYLVYNKTFWSSNELGIQLVWVNQQSDESIKLKEKHPWINGISGFDVLKTNPNILVGWIGGEEAKMIESIEDDVICSVCTELFKLFLKNPNILPPIKVIRSQWFHNHYIKGAYSYRTMDFYESPTSLYDLKHPLCSTYKTKHFEFEWPSVIFAGEAVDEKSFSSVHGAFRSGLEAVNPLIETCSHIEIYEDI